MRRFRITWSTACSSGTSSHRNAPVGARPCLPALTRFHPSAAVSTRGAACLCDGTSRAPRSISGRRACPPPWTSATSVRCAASPSSPAFSQSRRRSVRDGSSPSPRSRVFPRTTRTPSRSGSGYPAPTTTVSSPIEVSRTSPRARRLRVATRESARRRLRDSPARQTSPSCRRDPP